VTKEREIKFISSHGVMVEDFGSHIRAWGEVVHCDTKTHWHELQEFWPLNDGTYNHRDIRDWLGY
jgi:hypothetical protein